MGDIAVKAERIKEGLGDGEGKDSGIYALPPLVSASGSASGPALHLPVMDGPVII